MVEEWCALPVLLQTTDLINTPTPGTHHPAKAHPGGRLANSSDAFRLNSNLLIAQYYRCRLSCTMHIGYNPVSTGYPPIRYITSLLQS